MPPMHFEMELTKPCIIGKTRFLRRNRPGTLYGHEILRKNDTTFQLFGAGIFAMREIDNTTPRPEIVPITGGTGKDSLKQRIFTSRFSRGESTCKRQSIARLRSQHIIMGFFFGQFGISFPAKTHVIGRLIELAFKGCRMCIFGHDGRFMFIGLRPVAGIVGMFSSRIRETQFYSNLSRRKQRRNNLCTDFIMETIASSNNGNRLAVDTETADYLAVPQIEFLIDTRQLIDFYGRSVFMRQLQTDSAQMKTMRIHPIPVGGFPGATGFIKLHGIKFFMSATEIIRFQGLLKAIIFGIGKRMPPPLGLRSQRHAGTI